MTAELEPQNLRANLDELGSLATYADDAWAQIAGRLQTAPTRTRRPFLFAIPAFATLVIVAVVAALVVRSDDSEKNTQIRVATLGAGKVRVTVPQVPADAVPAGFVESALGDKSSVVCVERGVNDCKAYGGQISQTWTSPQGGSISVFVVFGYPDQSNVDVKGPSDNRAMRWRDVTVQGNAAKIGKVSSSVGSDTREVGTEVAWSDGGFAVLIIALGPSEDDVLGIANAMRPTPTDVDYLGYPLKPLSKDTLVRTEVPTVRIDGEQACLSLAVFAPTPQCGATDRVFLGPVVAGRVVGGDGSVVVVGAAPLAVTAVEVTGPNGEQFTTSVTRSPVGDFNVLTARRPADGNDGDGDGVYTLVAKNAQGDVVEEFRQLVLNEVVQQLKSDAVGPTGAGLRTVGDPFTDVFPPAAVPINLADSLSIQRLAGGFCVQSDGCVTGAWKLDGGGVVLISSGAVSGAEGPTIVSAGGAVAPNVALVAFEVDGKVVGGTQTFGDPIPQLDGWRLWRITLDGVPSERGVQGPWVQAVFYGEDGAVIGRTSFSPY